MFAAVTAAGRSRRELKSGRYHRLSKASKIHSSYPILPNQFEDIAQFIIIVEIEIAQVRLSV